MPASTRETFLGRYHYDPLDRLIDCALFHQEPIQRYYCKTRLSTEIQGAVQRTIVQHDDLLLAQQQREGDKVAAKLLATDRKRSVLNALDATRPNALAYSPYGHRPQDNGLLSLLGFNGERPDPVTGHYHLGSGYRQFNPVLMRFNSPDSWSPFGEGGLNAYGYCGGEPVNRNDPSAHTWRPIKNLLRRIGVMKKPAQPANTVRIGAWEQMPGNSELMLPSSPASKAKAKQPTKLTNKQVKEIHKQLDEAVVEGQAANQNGLAATTRHQARSLDSVRNYSNDASNYSPLSDSLEHISREELAQLNRTVSAWPDVGTERNNILNAVTREENFRSITIHKEPPISNRSIRRGEPGYSPR